MENEERQEINELIRRISLGEENALAMLYDTIGGRMLSVAFGVLRDRELSEDAVQESLVKIVRFSDKFRLWQNGYGWVCTIVKNTSLNILKSRQRRGEVPLDDFYCIADKNNTIEQTALSVTVKTAVEKLTMQQRQVIILKYYEDLTVRKIAACMNISKSKVQRLIDAAEEELKKYLI